MKELRVSASVDNLDEVTAFVDSVLEEHDCRPKVQIQIDVAVEEIFVNIAHYAYVQESEPGEAVIQVSVLESPLRAVITFIDEGIPYNPLEKPDPDTSLSAEEREIGGLGIFMVKKSMDDMRYEHVDDKNILTIEKNL